MVEEEENLKMFFGTKKKKIKKFLNAMRSHCNSERNYSNSLGYKVFDSEIERIRLYMYQGNQLFKNTKKKKYSSFIEDFKWLTKTMIDSLASQMYVSFHIPDTYTSKTYNGTGSIEEILKNLSVNEKIFRNNVQKALSFFGENFLEEKLNFQTVDSRKYDLTINNSVTIRQAIEYRTSNWLEITVKKGVPIPYYSEIFNQNLKTLCKKYIDSRITTN